ncbi:fumarylacetoacetate hydrolase family protein [Albimonas sp. CAU 1670]|uniref:fumarylacetoacetate hydrolase family protein n=1 Tax=Albimonas sp. CAU 1670 TaxID=3032599 RepID=UPI0023DB5422|nr:fumarylacetoacetate hydrolase family protein [Albimonas sp. CAU 1670]MDF2234367.1 fumarylacetoacetate hydrolase family protein [Albimonas sp. CAU 1670]
MKLLRWGPRGAEKPGMLDAEGAVRDLSGVIDDLTPATVTLESLERLRAVDPASLPVVTPERIGAILSRVETFHAIGLNYGLHADETGSPHPKEPIVFAKAASCLAGPDDTLVIPKDSVKTDWEVELGVVIGKVTEHVSEAEALSCVAGYCVANDVSEREWQQERGGTWCKGKGAPGFGPLGPWLVTADEVPDPQALGIWLKLNGETVQNSSTSDMIFSVAEIVSYLSRFVRLVPGDVIVTGTPSGVGLGMKPQRFLKPGDTLELGVEGLGVQHQSAVAWPG